MRGEFDLALEAFNRAAQYGGQEDAELEKSRAGVARCTIQVGDIRKGRQLALDSGEARKHLTLPISAPVLIHLLLLLPLLLLLLFLFLILLLILLLLFSFSSFPSLPSVSISSTSHATTLYSDLSPMRCV